MTCARIGGSSSSPTINELTDSAIWRVAGSCADTAPTATIGSPTIAMPAVLVSQAASMLENWTAEQLALALGDPVDGGMPIR